MTLGSTALTGDHASIRRRNKFFVGKRLMLLASFSIVGPATGRISAWPLCGGVVIVGALLATSELGLSFARRLAY